MVRHSPSCCKVNMQRPDADPLSFLTPFTLRNASVAKEKLYKITASQWGFQEASAYVTEPPFLMKHTNTFLCGKKIPNQFKWDNLWVSMEIFNIISLPLSNRQSRWNLPVMSRFDHQRAEKLMDQQRQGRQSTACDKQGTECRSDEQELGTDPDSRAKLNTAL